MVGFFCCTVRAISVVTRQTEHSCLLSEYTGSFPDAQLPSKRIIGPKNYEFLTSKRVEFEEYLQVTSQTKQIPTNDELTRLWVSTVKWVIGAFSICVETSATPRVEQQSAFGRLSVSSQHGVAVPRQDAARRKPRYGLSHCIERPVRLFLFEQQNMPGWSYLISLILNCSEKASRTLSTMGWKCFVFHRENH